MSRPLFCITEDLIKFRDAVEDTGEIGPALDDWFASLEAEESQKLDDYVGLLRHWEMESAAAKAERDAYGKRATTRDNRIAEFKARLKLHLEATGRTEVVTATGRPIRIAGNGGLKVLVLAEGTNASEVPDEYRVVNVAFNKDAIRKALEAGEVLDFASFGERGSHVRIG